MNYVWLNVGAPFCTQQPIGQLKRLLIKYRLVILFVAYDGLVQIHFCTLNMFVSDFLLAYRWSYYRRDFVELASWRPSSASFCLLDAISIFVSVFLPFGALNLPVFLTLHAISLSGGGVFLSDLIPFPIFCLTLLLFYFSLAHGQRCYPISVDIWDSNKSIWRANGKLIIYYSVGGIASYGRNKCQSN